MTQPNVDLWQAGQQLANHVALNLSAALEHIQRELSIIDGFPERGEQVAVRASAELTTVERAAEARWQLTDAREQLRDQKATVLREIRDLNEYINLVMRLRVPKQVTKPDAKDGLCCSNQAGRHGVIEWGDPLCTRNPTKSGLCEPHYRKWLAARQRDGVDTSKDYEPARLETYHA